MGGADVSILPNGSVLVRRTSPTGSPAYTNAWMTTNDFSGDVMESKEQLRQIKHSIINAKMTFFIDRPHFNENLIKTVGVNPSRSLSVTKTGVVSSVYSRK